MGWCGLREFASVVFIVTVFYQPLPGGETFKAIAARTVILSIIVHSLTVNPLVALCGAIGREDGTNPSQKLS